MKCCDINIDENKVFPFVIEYDNKILYAITSIKRFNKKEDYLMLMNHSHGIGITTLGTGVLDRDSMRLMSFDEYCSFSAMFLRASFIFNKKKSLIYEKNHGKLFLRSNRVNNNSKYLEKERKKINN